MDIVKFDEVKKTWYEISRYTTDNDFSYELQIHKKLLDIFHVGAHYHYIFNCGIAAVEYASDSVKQILGISHVEDFTIEYLLTIIHPEDLPYFLDFENKVTVFFNSLPADKVLKYKVSYDYRVKRADGSYIRILQQVVTIQSDENGAVIRVLGVHTDITHLNKPIGSSLSFIGLDGEPSYFDVCKSSMNVPLLADVLTRREREILQEMLKGKTSQEIADTLFISKLTVDSHRKNIRRKTGTSSTIELTMKLMK